MSKTCPRGLAVAIFLFNCHGASWAADRAVVESPDGRVRFELAAGKTLEYAAGFAGKPILEASKLGIVIDGVNLGEGAVIGGTDRYQIDQTYPWLGNHSMATDKCNGLKVSLTQSKSHAAYTLEIRAYNDGVAFRHIVPGQGRRTPDEATDFRLPSGSIVWYHDLNDHYEGTHSRNNVAALARRAVGGAAAYIQIAKRVRIRFNHRGCADRL